MSYGAANAHGSRLECSFLAFRRRPLAAFAAFCAAGAAAGSCAGAPVLFWLALGLALLAVCLRSRRMTALLGAALFLSAAVVAWRFAPPEPFSREKAAVTGLVCAEPRYYEDSVCLTLANVTVDGESYPHRLRLYVYTRGAEPPACLYGDALRAEGVNVRAPKGRTGEYGYDQRKTLWRGGIGATASCSAENAVLSAGPASPLRLAAQARSALLRRVDALFGEDAPLARALLLGDKSALSEEEYAAFRDAGIVHLLAVSGLHVSALATALQTLLRRGLRLSRRASYLAVLPVLLCYAAVTGFPASILRATALFACMEAAPLFGRPADPLTGLAAAYLLLAALSPLRQFEPGFLLSFGAVLGLCTILPTLEATFLPRGKGLARRLVRSVARLFFASLAVLLSTLPAMACAFGGVTLWPLLLNVVAVPLGTAALPLLAGAVAVSRLSFPLGGAAARLAALPLRALSMIAGRVGTADAALRLALPRMAPSLCAVYFLALAACSPFFAPARSPRTARLRSAGLVALAAVAAVSWGCARLTVLREPGLSATFLDVGQGDSVLVNAQGRLYMVDTGRGSAAAAHLSGRAAKLDALFLTHSDLDHAGALAAVLQAGAPDVVYLPASWPDMTVAEETAAALAGREVRLVARGDVIPLSEAVECEVLYPARGGAPSGDNAGSLALHVRCGQGSLLLLGDLPDEALDGPLPDCDVLLLAHHGSASSSGEWALRSAAPSAAVLSVGPNSYGLPSAEALERLARLGVPLLRTDTGGDIHARVGPDGSVLVTSYLGAAEGM